MDIQVRRKRIQKGQVILRSNRWYVRYYLPTGKMASKWIADKDDRCHSKTCKPIRLLQQEAMLAVNSERDVEDKGGAIKLADFWAGTFSPFIAANRRKSTADSYEDLFRRHISPAVGPKRLSEIRTVDVSQLLTRMAESGLGRNTINHARSTLSAVLSHSCNLGLIQVNPVSGAKCLARAKAPSETEFYTEEEVAKTIEALDGMPDAQAAVGLSFYCGLRTSELQAIRWEDISLDREVLTVNQALVRRTLGPLKTPESHADIPLVKQVVLLLRAWKAASPESNHYVFQNGRGTPDDLREMVRRRIKPRLAEKKIAWKSWYAGRRGLGTLLARLRGPLAASQALRHRNMSVTMAKYIRQDKRELAEGMRLLGK
jgi:integrase